MVTLEKLRIVVFWRVKLWNSLMFQHHCISSACARAHFNIKRTMDCGDCQLGAKDRFCQTQLHLCLDIKFVDSLEEIVGLDIHLKK